MMMISRLFYFVLSFTSAKLPLPFTRVLFTSFVHKWWLIQFVCLELVIFPITTFNHHLSSPFQVCLFFSSLCLFCLATEDILLVFALFINFPSSRLSGSFFLAFATGICLSQVLRKYTLHCCCHCQWQQSGHSFCSLLLTAISQTKYHKID